MRSRCFTAVVGSLVFMGMAPAISEGATPAQISCNVVKVLKGKKQCSRLPGMDSVATAASVNVQTFVSRRYKNEKYHALVINNTCTAPHFPLIAQWKFGRKGFEGFTCASLQTPEIRVKFPWRNYYRTLYRKAVEKARQMVSSTIKQRLPKRHLVSVSTLVKPTIEDPSTNVHQVKLHYTCHDNYSVEELVLTETGVLPNGQHVGNVAIRRCDFSRTMPREVVLSPAPPLPDIILP